VIMACFMVMSQDFPSGNGKECEGCDKTVIRVAWILDHRSAKYETSATNRTMMFDVILWSLIILHIRMLKNYCGAFHYIGPYKNLWEVGIA